jgi:hypothetical protein
MGYMQPGFGYPNNYNPYFYPQMQTPANQVLQSSYPSFYNPITINNYYYGNAQPQQFSTATSIPQNYYSGEMNFGGLDQVHFQEQKQTVPTNRTPAYFSF